MNDVLENGDTVAAAIAPTLDKFVASAAPYLKKVTDELYGQLLDGVQDYLRENGEWNIGQEIERCRKVDRDNSQLRETSTELLAAAQLALSVAEKWIHDRLDGTGVLDIALAKLEPVRAAIVRATVQS